MYRRCVHLLRHFGFDVLIASILGDSVLGTGPAPRVTIQTEVGIYGHDNAKGDFKLLSKTLSGEFAVLRLTLSSFKPLCTGVLGPGLYHG